jgi:hypothetical protein
VAVDVGVDVPFGLGEVVPVAVTVYVPVAIGSFLLDTNGKKIRLSGAFAITSRMNFPITPIEFTAVKPATTPISFKNCRLEGFWFITHSIIFDWVVSGTNKIQTLQIQLN